MKTKSDLIKAAMFRAGWIGTGQQPAADESEQVSEAIDSSLAALADLRIVYIPDVEQIRDAYLEDLATIVAEAIVKTREPNLATIKNSQDRLKKMQAPTAARRTLQVDPILSHIGRRRF